MTPKVFHSDQSRDIHSQKNCDPLKHNRHQTRVRSLPLSWSMKTSRYTLDHLPSLFLYHLELFPVIGASFWLRNRLIVGRNIRYNYNLSIFWSFTHMNHCHFTYQYFTPQILDHRPPSTHNFLSGLTMDICEIIKGVGNLWLLSSWNFSRRGQFFSKAKK